MSSALESLKKLTKVVADTGDFDSMKQFLPRDATTNPSLILKAAEMPQYKRLVEKAVSLRKSPAESVDETIDRLLVLFGLEILHIVPGRVSTEVDARLSFDTEGTVLRAKRIIAMYAENGIPKERILIKIAATFEGITACKILEAEGIHCNMTLIFSLVQSVLCAESSATLISPFVGRIYDFFKAKTKTAYEESPKNDPGVRFVKSVYSYYKKRGIHTEIMGASFRYVGQTDIGTGWLRSADDLSVTLGGTLEEHFRSPEESH